MSSPCLTSLLLSSGCEEGRAAVAAAVDMSETEGHDVNLLMLLLYYVTVVPLQTWHLSDGWHCLKNFF